jgi:hypothetical protein
MQRIARDLPYLPIWWEDQAMAVSSKLCYTGFNAFVYDQPWTTRNPKRRA